MDLHCDILILGAGPAGLAASLAAAQAKKQIVILDDNPYPGGQIWRDGIASRLPWLAKHYRDTISVTKNIHLLCGARLIAICAKQKILYETAQDCGFIYYDKLIVCSGAREIFLPFPGWTLPGITGAGGLQTQIKQGLKLNGQRVVIAGSGALLMVVANHARKAGAEIILIAEQAPVSELIYFVSHLWKYPKKMMQAFKLFHSCYRSASQVICAQGDESLCNITVRHKKRNKKINCDRLAIGYGLLPNVEPAMLFGCYIYHGAVAVDYYQKTTVDNIFAAGECTGIGGSELAIIEGEIAGYAATGQITLAEARFKQRIYWQTFACLVNRTFALSDKLKTISDQDVIFCRCEDVLCREIANMSDWRSAKLASRCGMGACQGRICATIARMIYQWPLPVPRQPLSPARLETLLYLGGKK